MSVLLYVCGFVAVAWIGSKLARGLAGFIAPLSYTIPQAIKDLAKSRGLPVDTIAWAFFERYGSIIVGQAKLHSSRKIDQMHFAVACVGELVDDMELGAVRAPGDWESHLDFQRCHRSAHV
jgi:hypothetical protein